MNDRGNRRILLMWKERPVLVHGKLCAMVLGLDEELVVMQLHV